MKNIILGVDPSTRSTGYAVIKEKTLIDYGVLKLDGHMIDRVGKFYLFFLEKIKEHSINVLAIETPFVGRNVATYGKLSYLRGVLYALAYTHDIPLFELSPSEVKQGITGHGKASKEQVANVVRMLFKGLPPKLKDDITDAISVSYCCLNKL